MDAARNVIAPEAKLLRTEANSLSPFLDPIWRLATSTNPKPSSIRALLSTMPGLVSATGVLAFLAEDEPELKVFALQTLNDDIDTVWTEVAGSLSQMCVVLFPFAY